MIILQVDGYLLLGISKSDWIQIGILIVAFVVGYFTIYYMYKGNAEKRKKNKLDNQLRKNENKPFFVSGNNIQGYVLDYYGKPRKIETQFSLINRGKKAFIENIEFDDNSMKDDINPLIDKMILKDKIIQFKFSPTFPCDSFQECPIKFKIFYRDVEGNKYYQNVEGKFKGKPKISNPTEI